MMTKSGHLWAVGYADMGRADQVRDEIINLGWNKQYLELDDESIHDHVVVVGYSYVGRVICMMLERTFRTSLSSAVSTASARQRRRSARCTSATLPARP